MSQLINDYYTSRYMKKVVLIGPCGGGEMPKNGASAKNYHLVKFLREKNARLKVIDTEQWRKNPKVLFEMFFTILFNPKAKFIIATDNMSGYRTMLAFSMFPRKRSVIYWIIGGSIANWIKEGKVGTKAYKIVETFIAEGKKMQDTFAECGYNNTLYVPNFKNINYIPKKREEIDPVIRFVFLSRIIPQKGCNLILKAVGMLNMSHNNKFTVDFFGPIDDSYRSEFEPEVAKYGNVSYRGFLDLRVQENYDELSKYDVMLFPTYWDGEGFPGIAIDAFVSGLPVIATDWSLNADIIKDGKTGVILPVKINEGVNTPILEQGGIPFDENVVTEELVEAMESFIANPAKVREMSVFCQEAAMQYDIKNVLTKDLFKKIGLEL